MTYVHIDILNYSSKVSEISVSEFSEYINYS
jgi:hypothetical protein